MCVCVQASLLRNKLSRLVLALGGTIESKGLPLLDNGAEALPPLPSEDAPTEAEPAVQFQSSNDAIATDNDAPEVPQKKVRISEAHDGKAKGAQKSTKPSALEHTTGHSKEATRDANEDHHRDASKRRARDSNEQDRDVRRDADRAREGDRNRDRDVRERDIGRDRVRDGRSKPDERERERGKDRERARDRDRERDRERPRGKDYNQSAR